MFGSLSRHFAFYDSHRKGLFPLITRPVPEGGGRGELIFLSSSKLLSIFPRNPVLYLLISVNSEPLYSAHQGNTQARVVRKLSRASIVHLVRATARITN